jgi:hypothetical protein
VLIQILIQFIFFNQVKALAAIASSESMHGVRKFSVPDKTALTSLAVSSSGDIRSAINALQFACLNGILSR